MKVKRLTAVLLAVLLSLSFVTGLPGVAAAAEENTSAKRQTALKAESSPQDLQVKTPQTEGEPLGYVTIAVETFSLGQGYLKAPARVPFYEGDSVAYILDRFLGGSSNYQKTGSLDSGFYLSAVKVSENKTITPPQYILDEIEKNDGDISFTRDSAQWLGEFDYTFMAGWMYAVNNWFPNYGMSDYKPGDGERGLKDGDVIRIQYTLYGYGMDIGGGYGGEGEGEGTF